MVPSAQVIVVRTIPAPYKQLPLAAAVITKDVVAALGLADHAADRSAGFLVTLRQIATDDSDNGFLLRPGPADRIFQRRKGHSCAAIYVAPCRVQPMAPADQLSVDNAMRRSTPAARAAVSAPCFL